MSGWLTWLGWPRFSSFWWTSGNFCNFGPALLHLLLLLANRILASSLYEWFRAVPYGLRTFQHAFRFAIRFLALSYAHQHRCNYSAFVQLSCYDGLLLRPGLHSVCLMLALWLIGSIEIGEYGWSPILACDNVHGAGSFLFLSYCFDCQLLIKNVY